MTLLRSAAARAVYCRTEKRGDSEKWACDTSFEVETNNWGENGVHGVAQKWGVIVSSSETRILKVLDNVFNENILKPSELISITHMAAVLMVFCWLRNIFPEQT